MPSTPNSIADPAVEARERGIPQPPYDIVVDEYDADTVPVFCKKNRISVAFYYKLKALGQTPREMHLGRKRLISRAAAEEWRLEREAGVDTAV